MQRTRARLRNVAFVVPVALAAAGCGAGDETVSRKVAPTTNQAPSDHPDPRAATLPEKRIATH